MAKAHRAVSHLAPVLRPFLALELSLGNEVAAAHASDDLDSVRVELVRPLHVEELRAGLAWPSEVEVYESWAPHDPTERGVRWIGARHVIAAPNPLFDRLRPPLEALARALVEGRYADVASSSRGAVSAESVRRAIERLKRRKAGRPALPPPEAYKPAGCGDGRASIHVIRRPAPTAKSRTWRILFDVWTERGNQSLAYELAVTEAASGALDVRLIQLTEGN